MAIMLTLACLMAVPAAAPPADFGPVEYEGRTLSQWLAELHTAEGERWYDAAQALGEFGRRGAAAAPLLAARLPETTPDSCGHRAVLLNTLTALGPGARPAVPALTRVAVRGGLRDGPQALRALAAIGEGAAGAAPELLRTFDAPLRYSLYQKELPLTLAAIAPRDPAVRRRLRQVATGDEFEVVRLSAARALWRLRDPGIDVGAVVTAAGQSKKSDVRIDLAAWLGEMAPTRADARERLLSLLLDPASDVRLQAAFELEECRPGGPAAVRAYRLALKSKDGHVRCTAVEHLGDLKSQATSAVMDLFAAMGDKRGMVRSAAAFALWQIDPTHRDVAVRGLLSALADESENTRAHAAERLGWMGPDARAALPALQQLRADPWIFVRKVAGRAIGAIEAARQ